MNMYVIIGEFLDGIQSRRVCWCTNPDSLDGAGEHDAGGIYSDPVNPRLQIFRERLESAGPSDKKAKELIGAFQQRCPVYTITVRANRD